MRVYPAKFLPAPGLVWQVALKKTKVKLGLSTDINMLLTIEKGLRGKIFHSIYRYEKGNNKYIKDNDKNKEVSYLQYWEVNNLYDRAMSQKLPVSNFEWIKKDFTKIYNEESNEGYFLEVDVQYLEKLDEFHNDLLFLPEKIKIEKVKKLIASLNDKTEYIIHIRNLKQALNNESVLKKVYRVIKFNQIVQLKPYIDMNTDLKKFFKVEE